MFEEYHSEFTGVQIDQRLKWAKHENLLDNPWFTVNQRGQDVYENAAVYTLDRWKASTANIRVSRVSGGVGVILEKYKSELSGRIVQTVDAPYRFNNKTVTLSALIKNTTGCFILMSINGATTNLPGIVISSKSYASYTLLSATVKMPSSVTSLTTEIGMYNSDELSPIGTMDIRAVKLELGSVSTLESDIIPEYDSELLRCQRYFQRIKNSSTVPLQLGVGFAQTDSIVSTTIQLPTSMRVLPTVTVSDPSHIGCSRSTPGNAVACTSVTRGGVVGVENNMVTINCNGTWTIGLPYLVSLTNGGYIDFSADL